MEVIKQFTKDQYSRIIQDKIFELSEKDFNLNERVLQLQKEIEEFELKIKDGYTQIQEYDKDLEEMLYHRLDIVIEAVLKERSSIFNLWNFRYGKQNIIDDEITFFISGVGKYVSWKEVPSLIPELLSSYSKQGHDTYIFHKIISLVEEHQHQTGVVSHIYPILQKIRNCVTHRAKLENEVKELKIKISKNASEIALLEKERDFTDKYVEETSNISLKTSILDCLLEK